MIKRDKPGVQLPMYFCSQFHSRRNIINTTESNRKYSPMFYRLVFFCMTRFQYFGVGECTQFTCNCSDVNLVNREANLYFLNLVPFHPYLESA